MELELNGPRPCRYRSKGLHLLPTPLNSPTQIDEAVDYLTAQLTRIADVSTPRRKVSQGQGEPWWDNKSKRHSIKPVQLAGNTPPPRQSRVGAPYRTPVHINSTRSGTQRLVAGAVPSMMHRRIPDSSGVLSVGHRLCSHLPPKPLSLLLLL